MVVIISTELAADEIATILITLQRLGSVQIVWIGIENMGIIKLPIWNVKLVVIYFGV